MLCIANAPQAVRLSAFGVASQTPPGSHRWIYEPASSVGIWCLSPRLRTGLTRADRQTLMFSATWPPSIQQLAAEFLCNPAHVTIGSLDLSASHSIAQVPLIHGCVI